MAGEDIIDESASLRTLGDFDEAIALIEANIDSIDVDLKLNAYLEAFYASEEKGDLAQTKKYAALAAKEYPDIPSIQKYL